MLVVSRFLVVNLVVVLSWWRMQRIDEEEYGGTQALMTEGLPPAVGLFLVRLSLESHICLCRCVAIGMHFDFRVLLIWACTSVEKEALVCSKGRPLDSIVKALCLPFSAWPSQHPTKTSLQRHH